MHGFLLVIAALGYFSYGARRPTGDVLPRPGSVDCHVRSIARAKRRFHLPVQPDERVQDEQDGTLLVDV
jgi:hypothetical protein